MPDTRKEKLMIAVEALNNAKKKMTDDELRDFLNKRLQSGAAPQGMRLPISEVEEVPPPVFDEDGPKMETLPQIGEAKKGMEKLPAKVGEKAKIQKLPYITRKKSKLYEMMK